MTKNYFFIDDSGSRVWEDSYVKELADTPPDRGGKNLEYWHKNYSVLTGIHVSTEKLNTLNQLINREKEELFGTKDVEIKSDWLRRDEKRKKHYLNPYNISEGDLRDFVEKFWYGLFQPGNITIQAFVLEKRIFAERSKSPTELLTQSMFETIRAYPHTITNIIFDQMENGLRSRSGDQGVVDEVAISSNIFNEHPFVQSIVFEDSSRSNFLQIADTAAYNVYRNIYMGYSGNDEVYPYLEKILPCFYGGDGEGGIYNVQI